MLFSISRLSTPSLADAKFGKNAVDDCFVRGLARDLAEGGICLFYVKRRALDGHRPVKRRLGGKQRRLGSLERLSVPLLGLRRL